jgi:hypothetical protein
MAKADYGPYGDETLSYRVTVKDDISWSYDIAFVRKANLLAGVMVGNIGNGASKDARAIVDKVASKLPR